MRHIQIREPGGPEVLVMAHSEATEPSEGQVRIAVRAAGVNRPDLLQRQGRYAPPPDASPIPGLEVAGVIDRVGPEVSCWNEGDEVCALTHGGGYAESVVVDARHCLPLPEGLSFTEAACLPETTFTVWFNVFARAGLRPGERLLIHGGSSGIGTTAIQMARLHGAEVYATAGSDDKCQVCLDLGATMALNYREQDFVSALKEATQGHGIDVILDMVGGSYLQRNLKVAASDGRIAQIAFLEGARQEVDFSPFLKKRLTMTGSTLRPLAAQQKADIAADLQREVWPWLASGKMKPVVTAQFPLQEAAAAHREMDQPNHYGKVVLVVDAS